MKQRGGKRMTMRMMLIMALGLTVLITHAQAQCSTTECGMVGYTNTPFTWSGLCYFPATPLTNQVPITVSTYRAEYTPYQPETVGMLGINITWKTWPTNSNGSPMTYELQWTTNLVHPIWFTFGNNSTLETNTVWGWSGIIQSCCGCSRRFFRVMSGGGPCGGLYCP